MNPKASRKDRENNEELQTTVLQFGLQGSYFMTRKTVGQYTSMDKGRAQYPLLHTPYWQLLALMRQERLARDKPR